MNYKIYLKLICILLLVSGTKILLAQDELMNANLLFPDQLKFQVLYNELGTKQSDMDLVLDRISPYFSLNRKVDSDEFEGVTYVYVNDLNTSDKDVEIMLHFNENGFRNIYFYYSKDEYLKLFGALWKDENEASKKFPYLELADFNTDEYHRFDQPYQLEIRHSKLSKKEYKLHLGYYGEKGKIIDKFAEVPPIKKGDIYSSVFPYLSQYRFEWMAQQLGRKDPIHLYYDFIQYLNDVTVSDVSLKGKYAFNENLTIEVNRPDKDAHWNTLTFTVPQLPNDSAFFPLFKTNWNDECAFAEQSKAFKSIDCSENKHVFEFNSYETFTHSKTDHSEILVLYDTSKRDPSFKDQYFKEYDKLSTKDRPVSFKGRTNENGNPDGQILVNYQLNPEWNSSSIAEIYVQDGKVVNDPEHPFVLPIGKEITYEGALDPNSWEPIGQGKYTYSYNSGWGNTVELNRIMYEGSFSGYMEPDLSQAMYVKCANEENSFRGTLKLYNLVDLYLDKRLVFEGNAIYIPDDQPNDRYAGYFVMVHDGYWYKSYPHGEHEHQQFINGEWKTVDKTIYNVMDGSINGNDYYGSKEKLDIDLLNKYSFFYPYQAIYDQATEDKFTSSVLSVLKGIRVSKNKVAGTSSYLSNNELFGYLGNRDDESGLKPSYTIPGFDGLVIDVKAINKYRETKQFIVAYFMEEPYENDYATILSANKINKALFEAANDYFGHELDMDKYVRTLNSSSSKFDDYEAARFVYQGTAKDSPTLTLRIYVKNSTVQYLIIFDNSI